MRNGPVIGYTIEIEDPMLRDVEPGLREPLERFGATALALPRSTPPDRIDHLLDLVDGIEQHQVLHVRVLLETRSLELLSRGKGDSLALGRGARKQQTIAPKTRRTWVRLGCDACIESGTGGRGNGFGGI